MRPVFFLSDFGLEDPYVGVVKAILWEKAPGVPVLDLAHALPPPGPAPGCLRPF